MGNHWGSRGNEQREIKWQKSERRCRSRGMDIHTQICWTCVCLCKHLPRMLHTRTNKLTWEYTFARPSSLIHTCFLWHLTHINRYLRIHIISCRIPHTLTHTHTPLNYHQSQASEPSPPRVHGSFFGSVSMQVGGLLILTTGLAHYTLMQHTPPLRALYVPFSFFFSTSPAIKSNLCAYKHTWRWITLQVGVFSFFFFPNIRCFVCDCALFSSKCRLTQKPVEAYSMFQDHTWYPWGIFQGVSLYFHARFLHCWPIFKALTAKTNIRDSNEGRGVAPFSIQAKQRDTCDNLFGPHLKNKVTFFVCFTVFNKVKTRNGMQIFVRDTHWSLHCAKNN